MSRARAEALRMLALQDLQLLLGAEPELAEAFRVLAAGAQGKELRKLCQEGVSYTRRRVERIKKALRLLDAPRTAISSSGLAGLIRDAKRVAARQKSAANDAALLATVERISHFGLAAYTSVDRYLRGAEVPEARRQLTPSLKEKREAIAEMSRMARRRLLPRVGSPEGNRKRRNRPG